MKECPWQVHLQRSPSREVKEHPWDGHSVVRANFKQKVLPCPSHQSSEYMRILGTIPGRSGNRDAAGHAEYYLVMRSWVSLHTPRLCLLWGRRGLGGGTPLRLLFLLFLLSLEGPLGEGSFEGFAHQLAQFTSLHRQACSKCKLS